MVRDRVRIEVWARGGTTTKVGDLVRARVKVGDGGRGKG